MPNPPVAARLHWAIQEVCPIHGVAIKELEDRSTWCFHEKDEATPEEIQAARAVLASFDPNAVYEQPQPAGVVSEAMLSELEEAKAKIDERPKDPEQPPEAIADLFQADRPLAPQAQALQRLWVTLGHQVQRGEATDDERRKHERLSSEIEFINKHAFDGV